jgi:predicted RNA binding protein YcfA (HicA-like mRNA interferase family)
LTYGELWQLLIDLGFVQESVAGSHRAFRHAGSDILIVLPYDCDPSELAGDADLASVRRHLEEGGIATPGALDVLAAVRTPDARGEEEPGTRD